MVHNSSHRVKLLTADWVHWYNTNRLMHRLGRTPPVEFESAYHTQQAAAKTEAHHNQVCRKPGAVHWTTPNQAQVTEFVPTR